MKERNRERERGENGERERERGKNSAERNAVKKNLFY